MSPMVETESNGICETNLFEYIPFPQLLDVKTFLITCYVDMSIKYVFVGKIVDFPHFYVNCKV